MIYRITPANLLAFVICTLSLLATGCKEESGYSRGERWGEEPRVQLAQRFAPGVYETTRETTTCQTIHTGGRTMRQQVVQHVVTELVASDPNDRGEQTLAVRYKKFRQEVQAPSPIVFDTDDPSSLRHPQMGPILKALREARITFRVNGKGDVIHAEGLDSMWDELAKINPRLGKVIATMRQQMGDSALKEMLKQDAWALPDQPVGKGAVWRKDIEHVLPMLGQATSQLTCNLKELERNDAGMTAVIEYTGRTTTERESEISTGAATVTVRELDMQQNGTLVLDVSTGLVAETRMKQEGGFSMLASSKGQSSEVQCELKVESTTKTRKLDDAGDHARAPRPKEAKLTSRSGSRGIARLGCLGRIYRRALPHSKRIPGCPENCYA